MVRSHKNTKYTETRVDFESVLRQISSYQIAAMMYKLKSTEVNKARVNECDLMYFDNRVRTIS